MEGEDENHEDKGSPELQEPEVIPKQEKKKKFQKKLEGILEKVVSNSSSFPHNLLRKYGFIEKHGQAYGNYSRKTLAILP
jgi:hypothetical protein